MIRTSELLDKWYAKYPYLEVRPGLMEHDVLHALLDEPPTWRGEIKVGVLEYTYLSLLSGKSLTVEGARRFLQTVVEAVKPYAPKARDFLTEVELSQRITASVKILRQIGLENIPPF